MKNTVTMLSEMNAARAMLEWGSLRADSIANDTDDNKITIKITFSNHGRSLPLGAKNKLRSDTRKRTQTHAKVDRAACTATDATAANILQHYVESRPSEARRLVNDLPISIVAVAGA